MYDLVGLRQLSERCKVKNLRPGGFDVEDLTHLLSRIDLTKISLMECFPIKSKVRNKVM